MIPTYFRRCLAAGLALVAGSAAAAKDHWTHTVVLYGVGASMEGEAGVGNVTADVDVGFDDILDNLEFGAMASWRAERGKWSVLADLIYMRLEQKRDGLGPFGGTRAAVDADQVITELDGGYALTDRLSVYGGLRYWNLDTDLQVVGGGPLGETLAASANENWVDPLVGLRYVLPLSASWELVAKGDIGGFGVGSDFAWHTTVFAGWTFAEHATLLMGFRVLGVDYEDGSGPATFRWDVTEGGPALGVAWRF